MTDKQIEDYIEAHCSPQDAVLHQLYRKTQLEMILPRMISGPVQGKFLQMISQMMQPRRILEIGTFTGYGAISLAKGLSADGKLITIEKNEELEDTIRQFVDKSGNKGKIQVMFGDALKIIGELDECFDIVYIDADKAHYTSYYELVIDKVRPGGIVLADNVLWGGKVLNPSENDPDTQAIVAFNTCVKEDHRVEQLILPLRDGLMVIRKN
jgi:caffeoyl-CoA O-methyltransferase